MRKLWSKYENCLFKIFPGQSHQYKPNQISNEENDSTIRKLVRKPLKTTIKISKSELKWKSYTQLKLNAKTEILTSNSEQNRKSKFIRPSHTRTDTTIQKNIRNTMKTTISLRKTDLKWASYGQMKKSICLRWLSEQI